MKEYKSLSHTRWDCKYHVVFIPKYRRKKMYGAIRTHLGKILHEMAKQKEARILEGHLMSDHVHMCISIPPKFAVSNVVGFIKGESAISVARNFRGRRRNFTGESFWDVSRGSWKKNGALHSVIRVSDQAATSACLRTSLRPW